MSPQRPLAELLERQIRHRYRALDRALSAGVGPSQSSFQLGGRPTIAWHARHVGEAIESTHQAVFGDLPKHESWDLGYLPPTAVGPEVPLAEPLARPPTRPLEQWPAQWDLLRDAVLAAADELSDRLSLASDEELSKPPLVPILPAFQASLPTRQSFLEGHIYHVTYHVGSVAGLRAEMGLDL